MEPLIDLAIGVNQVRVVNGQHIVDTYVNINTRVQVLIPQNRHFDSRHIAQSPRLGNFLDNLSAVFDQKVLIMCHPIMKHNH